MEEVYEDWNVCVGIRSNLESQDGYTPVIVIYKVGTFKNVGSGRCSENFLGKYTRVSVECKHYDWCKSKKKKTTPSSRGYDR